MTDSTKKDISSQTETQNSPASIFKNFLVVFNVQGLAFADLTLSELGGDTTVDYISGSITLEGIASITLDEQDFVFA